jgi:hypothetical protein
LWDKEAVRIFSHKNLTDISLSPPPCLSYILTRFPILSYEKSHQELVHGYGKGQGSTGTGPDHRPCSLS